MKGIPFSTTEGPCPFPRGDNYEKVKIHWRNLKIFFSRTTGPISTKLGIEVSLGEQDFSLFQWRVALFYRGDNYEIAKLHWRNLKISTQGFTNKVCLIIKKGYDWLSPLSINLWYNHIFEQCIYWFELVSKVSDEAQGLLFVLVFSPNGSMKVTT